MAAWAGFEVDHCAVPAPSTIVLQLLQAPPCSGYCLVGQEPFFLPAASAHLSGFFIKLKSLSAVGALNPEEHLSYLHPSHRRLLPLQAVL